MKDISQLKQPQQDLNWIFENFVGCGPQYEGWTNSLYKSFALVNSINVDVNKTLVKKTGKYKL